MGHILGLKFKDYGQVYYFDSGPFVVARDEYVIVKTELGMGLGKVVLIMDEVPEEAESQEIKPIYRLATDEDLERLKENDAMAAEAFDFCRQCVHEHKLDMKLVDVDVYFDRSKIVFFFTAPNRIDFRELVKDLVKNYRTRIELRQIGVRHETQMVGAVGNCGQVCCCRRFLRKFAPVTIRMAKEQNLFLNPTKISGICGRLLCCLNYEQKNYESFRKNCPKMGKRYDTTQGAVKVIRANMFRESLTLLTYDGQELEVSIDEWHEMDARRMDPAQFQQQQQLQQQQQAERQKSRPPRKKVRPRNRSNAAGAPDEAADRSERDASDQSDAQFSPDNGQNSGAGGDAADVSGATVPATYDLADALAGDGEDAAATPGENTESGAQSEQGGARRSRSKRSRRKPRSNRKKQAQSSGQAPRKKKSVPADDKGSGGDSSQGQSGSPASGKEGDAKPRRKRRRRPRKRSKNPKESGADNRGSDS